MPKLHDLVQLKPYLSMPPLCRLSSGRATSALGCAGLEAVLEFAGDGLERPHAARAGGLSPLGLLTPVVYVIC